MGADPLLKSETASAVLTIYAVPASLYCAKLRIVLRHKSLAWRELPPPGGYGSDEYKALVPSGNLPTLLDGDLRLADSEAIAEYLDEKYPAPPMLPQAIPARAKCRELSRFHDTRLEPALRGLFPVLKPSARDESVIAAQQASLNERLQQLARMLPADTHSGAPALTLADCGFPITFAWLNALESRAFLKLLWPDEVIRYGRRIAQCTAVRVELESYLPSLDAYIQTLSPNA